MGSTVRPDAPAPQGAGQAVLEVRQVQKRFGQTLALQDVSLDVLRGEVHALLGHNGSGKSTLVKIISGVLHPDAGSVRIAGLSAAPAQVGVVHQDLGLCRDATVLENCCMTGYRTNRYGAIDWAWERSVVEPILESLAAGFSCSTMVRDLSPADQAVVAIARALKRASGARQGSLDLLILDEATARLRGRDAEKVLSTARLVARQGGGVLIVTHHMAEVLQAADRATVLMNGSVAGTVNVADTTEESLLELASGRRVAAPARHTPNTDLASRQDGAALLRVSRLSGERVACTADILVNAGEIVGLTGAPGAGHEEIPYLIAGVARRGSALVAVAGQAVAPRHAPAARRAGIRLVPADRLAQGLLLQANIRENLSPLIRARHLWARLYSRRRETAWAQEVCLAFQVKPGEPETPIGNLSGGNQQKVLLARALEDRPRVLLLHEPTEGVDETTRRALAELIHQAAAAGAAVLYVSSDIDEVAGYAHRVLVMREGDVAAEFTGGPGAADDIYAASYLTHEAA